MSEVIKVCLLNIYAGMPEFKLYLVLRTVSDQKLDSGKTWERDYNYCSTVTCNDIGLTFSITYVTYET